MVEGSKLENSLISIRRGRGECSWRDASAVAIGSNDVDVEESIGVGKLLELFGGEDAIGDGDGVVFF